MVRSLKNSWVRLMRNVYKLLQLLKGMEEKEEVEEESLSEDEEEQVKERLKSLGYLD